MSLLSGLCGIYVSVYGVKWCVVFRNFKFVGIIIIKYRSWEVVIYEFGKFKRGYER